MARLPNSPKIIVAELHLEPRPSGCRSTSSPTVMHNHFWAPSALSLETGTWSLMALDHFLSWAFDGLLALPPALLDQTPGVGENFKDHWMPSLHPLNVCNSPKTPLFIKVIQSTFAPYLFFFRQWKPSGEYNPSLAFKEPIV